MSIIRLRRTLGGYAPKVPLTAAERALIGALHRDFTDSANQIQVASAANRLTAYGANVLVGLAALGLFLFLLQSVTGKRDFQNVPVRAEILDERLAREGGRIAVRAVVFDSKVAGLALLLKELVVVTAVLASLLQVVLATIEVDHFVKHGRCSVLAGTVQKLGADVDFILALVLAVRQVGELVQPDRETGP